MLAEPAQQFEAALRRYRNYFISIMYSSYRESTAEVELSKC